MATRKRPRELQQSSLDRFLKSDSAKSAGCTNHSKKVRVNNCQSSKRESTSGSKTSDFVEKKGYLVEIKGDLFSCSDDESLAHCISQDVRMGKGIAAIFKKKFGGLKDLQAQGVKPGGVAVLKRGSRFVYYLITKQKCWQLPTYTTLQESLEATARHCKENNVTKLSMPRLGCGLDKLDWGKVREMIRDVFKDNDITITVYTL